MRNFWTKCGFPLDNLVPTMKTNNMTRNKDIETQQ